MFKENPAILSVMEPGDRIIATMRGTERFRLVLGMLASVVLGVGWFLAVVFSHENFAVAVPVFIVAAAVNLVVWSRQKPCFVAITERLLICHGVTWLVGKPTRLLFTAPLPTVSVTTGNRNPLLGTAFRYHGPGVSSRGLNLTVGSRSEEFLGLVLAALRAGGATVTGQQPGGQTED
jgi:hypothetical protein